MNQIMWAEPVIADLKQMVERRAQRLRREADLALSRFGRALIRNITRVAGFEGVYALERGGLRVFFRHDVQTEAVTILKVQDVRTPRVTHARRRAASGREISIALDEGLIGLAKEEMKRGQIGEAEEQICLRRLAALALGQYLRERGVDRVTSETGYMADPRLATLLGLAEVDVAGMSVSVCAEIDKATNRAHVPRVPFETGFISDYYVFAEVAEDLSRVRFLGFITDEELEESQEQRAKSREPRAESKEQEPSAIGDGRRTTYEVRLDQLREMAELESQLRAKSQEPRVIEGIPLFAEASDLEGALTSQQLGQQLFGEMPHESARDFHFSWLKGWLSTDDERRYLGHVFGCAECRTELLNFMVLREELEELHATVSPAPVAELAVAEPHPLARREVPETAELAPVVKGELVVLPVGPLARLRNAIERTLSASWAWAREHPMPAATSVAFAAAALFLLTMFFKTAEVNEQQLRRARTPHVVKVTAESKPGTSLERIPSVLTISNAQGDVLYTESFPANTGLVVHEKPVDLNGDGYLEVVFALGSRENPATTGRVFVYSFDEAFLTGQRDRPLMAPPYNTYHQLEYSYFPTAWSGSSFVDKLIVDDLWQNGGQKIVLIWRDVLYAGSALTVLSLPGKIEEGLVREAEYIHPGHIRHLEVVPIGEQKKILIAGMNNALRGTQLPFGQPDLYYSFIALLDPHQIWGEAPPYLQNEQGKGSQEWYGYFTPTGFRLGAPRLVDIDADGQEEILVEVVYQSDHVPSLGANPYTTFYLDPTGRLIKEELGDFPPPKRATYHLYDSSQVWWLGREEYERRYAASRRARGS